MSDIAANFRSRFIAALPEVPADLDLHLDEFVSFDVRMIPGNLADEDSSLLASQGLPRDAAPFLSFQAYSPSEVDSRKQVFGLPDSHFPIGHNGSGDVVAIDLDSREVVYFNHDNFNEIVFINSTLPQFAESLCVYQEHLTGRAMYSCLDAIAAVDSKAAIEGSMWQTEIASELADEA